MCTLQADGWKLIGLSSAWPYQGVCVLEREAYKYQANIDPTFCEMRLIGIITSKSNFFADFCEPKLSVPLVFFFFYQAD